MSQAKSFYEKNNNRDTGVVYYIISFVLSAIAFMLCLIPFINSIAIVLAIAATLFGVASYKRCKKAQENTTAAIIAIIISLFPTIISVGIIGVFLVYIK